jgi:DNA-directed RNA polymerase sigma subunit (sigma70/sigma32)
MSTAAKPKLPKVATSNSAAIKSDLALGRSIADRMVPVNSLEEVAQAMGVSYQYVRRVECLALAKLAHKLRKMRQLGEFEV